MKLSMCLMMFLICGIHKEVQTTFLTFIKCFILCHENAENDEKYETFAFFDLLGP